MASTGDTRFESAWVALLENRGLVCAYSGTRYPAIRRPDAIIIDVSLIPHSCRYPSLRFQYSNQYFALANIVVILARRDSVKIYGWVTTMTCSAIYNFGSESLGGRGDVHAKIEDEARNTGRPYEEIALRVCGVYSSSLLQYLTFVGIR